MRSACGRSSSTARTGTPGFEQRLTDLYTLSAALGLVPQSFYDSLDVPGWVIWAIVAVALAVGEILTPGLFFLGPVALGAVAAAIVAALGVGAAVQLIVFIAGALASLAFLRPIARAHIHMPAISRTGTAALVGTKAVVVQRVDSVGGRVRIGGEEWSARSYMDGQVFEAGTPVEVAEIKGATALVYE